MGMKKSYTYYIYSCEATDIAAVRTITGLQSVLTHFGQDSNLYHPLQKKNYQHVTALPFIQYIIYPRDFKQQTNLAITTFFA